MVVNLQNLRIQAQKPEQIDIQEEKIESTGSVWIDSLQQTGVDLQNQASSFDVEESQELPTFNIKPTAWVDEQKVQSFIQRGVELWKSKEEIENAYQKGLDKWTFTKEQEREFDDWWAFKKVFTESFPQAWKDIKRWLFRLGADVSKLKRWVFKEEILWWEVKEDKNIKKWILGRIWSTAIQRERGFAQRKLEQWETWATDIEKELDILWQWAWLASDIFWEVFISTLWTLATDEQEALTKKAIQDWLSSELWKEWIRIFKDQKEWFEEFERQNPRIWSLIRNGANFGILWLDIAWLWATKAWVKTTEEALNNFSKTIIDSSKTWLDKWVDIWKQAKDVLWKVWEEWLEWLWDIAEKKAKTLETKATELVRGEAEEIALPTLDELTKKWRGEVFKDVTEWWEIIRTPREWVAIEEVTRLINEGKIKKNMTEVKKRQVIESEIEDISKWLVDDLKKSDAKLTKDEMVTLFDDLSAKILDNPVLWNNKPTVTQLLDQLKKQLVKNDYFPEDILQLRKNLDSLVRKFKRDTVFDPKVENAFSVTLRDFRQWLNNKVWELVPDANVKNKLDRQSGLFEVTKTLQDRFSSEWGSFIKRTLQKIENFTWIPKTEIIELTTALWLIWVWSWIAVPIWIWVWATALWLRGLKSLWKATNKRKVAKLLKRFDDAVSKNPSKASQLKEVKSEIKKIFEDKKLKEKSVEQRLDVIQRILDIIEPSSQKKLPVWTKQPVITPQTAEKGVIQESKKGLKWKIEQPSTPAVEKAKLDLENEWLDAIAEATTLDELTAIKELVWEADISNDAKNILLQLIDEKLKDFKTVWTTKSAKLTKEDISWDLSFMIKQNIFDLKDDMPDVIKKFWLNPIDEIWEIESWVIRAYTESNFSKLNSSLRKNSISELNTEFSNILSDSISKLPKFKWKTYRWTTIRKEIFDKMKKWEELQDKWFWSSTKLEKEARTFIWYKSNAAANLQDRTNVIFEIKSKNWREIETVSFFPDEKEVLFNKNTKFIINDIQREIIDDWKWVLDDIVWHRIFITEK